MLNRKINPDFKQVSDIHFIHPINKQLSNGIPVYIINSGEQELVRVEFVFENSNWEITKPLLGISASGMINSGTSQLKAQEIAEKIDYYGAFLQYDYNADNTSLTLYTLNKHLTSVLPILWALLNDNIYPEDELSIYIKNHQQKLEVSLQKNDYLARKNFAHAIFGNTSYGVDIQPEDYNYLLREDILKYYQSVYQSKNCTIIVAGKFEDSHFKILDEIFGKKWVNEGVFTKNKYHFDNKSAQIIHIDKPTSVQTALRLGNLSINRNHQDFAALQILNCVLGGYFGSRLMSNIREDKGYTYGIGSGLVSLKQAGYFFIATEVGTEVANSALSEIEKEITLLREELLSENELSLVKNYMMGSLLGSLENSFSHADKFKNIHFSGLDYSYYSNYIHTVKTINPEKLKEVAQKYLNWSAMLKVVVGNKS